VIEPDFNTIAEFKRVNPEIFKCFTLVCEESPKNIYSNLNHVKFLIKKPVVIPHTPTFNLYHDYFKNYLTFSPNHLICEMSKNLQDLKLRNYLSGISEKERSLNWENL